MPDHVFEMLQQVTDHDSFIAFGEALAAERAEAAAIEAANPDSYWVDGALSWKNGTIEGFLDGALGVFGYQRG